MNTATFRFYEELNDFLPRTRRKTAFTHRFNGKPTVKDTIESLGVPHAEIDLILVNGTSVDFNYHLHNTDRVSVYPEFESLDISPIVRLRPAPLREPRFICDVHAGKTARALRMLGFDTLYRNDYDDHEIVEIARKEKRIILTRDQELLKMKAVSRGYWFRSCDTETRIREIIRRFDLSKKTEPFSRCIECNGRLEREKKERLRNTVPQGVYRHHFRFYRCLQCGKVFWRGSHYDAMYRRITGLGITPDIREK
jgi:hypothetical protein